MMRQRHDPWVSYNPIPIPLAGNRKAYVMLPKDGLRQHEAAHIAKVVTELYDLPPKQETPETE